MQTTNPNDERGTAVEMQGVLDRIDNEKRKELDGWSDIAVWFYNEFPTLTAYPAHELDNQQQDKMALDGWVVPVSTLFRNSVARTFEEVLRAFVVDYLSPIVNPYAVAIHKVKVPGHPDAITPDGTVVVVFRKIVPYRTCPFSGRKVARNRRRNYCRTRR